MLLKNNIYIYLLVFYNAALLSMNFIWHLCFRHGVILILCLIRRYCENVQLGLEALMFLSGRSLRADMGLEVARTISTTNTRLRRASTASVSAATSASSSAFSSSSASSSSSAPSPTAGPAQTLLPSVTPDSSSVTSHISSLQDSEFQEPSDCIVNSRGDKRKSEGRTDGREIVGDFFPAEYRRKVYRAYRHGKSLYYQQFQLSQSQHLNPQVHAQAQTQAQGRKGGLMHKGENNGRQEEIADEGGRGGGLEVQRLRGGLVPGDDPDLNSKARRGIGSIRKWREGGGRVEGLRNRMPAAPPLLRAATSVTEFSQCWT